MGRGRLIALLLSTPPEAGFLGRDSSFGAGAAGVGCASPGEGCDDGVGGGPGVAAGSDIAIVVGGDDEMVFSVNVGAASDAFAVGLGRSSSSGPSGPILRPALSSRFARASPPV